jgi:pimeloyl-ACP methyl ester carboxylesterase
MIYFCRANDQGRAGTNRIEARERFLVANRLRHHLIEWGTHGPIVLLLHGAQEHAHAWDFVAPLLATAGYHVFALDWRGHGETEWIGAGGYYHFADYTADLAAVVRQLGGSAALVGHSMGGNAALVYAGTEPQRVTALVTIEGLGPPDVEPEAAPERFAAWIADLERVEQREPREMTLEEAARRLREGFPLFSDAVARHMAEHGTIASGEKRRWRFDPLHQTRSPQPYYVRQAQAFWRRIRCPVLYIAGTASYLSLHGPEIAARTTALRAARVTIEGTGHHPHLESPTTTATAIIDFFAPVLRPGAHPREKEGA